MPNPQFIEEEPLCLVDVKEKLQQVETRDQEINYRSKKAKEFLATFVELNPEQKEQLHQKLVDLKLIRLKELYLAKLIDFLPQSVDELKVILQGYPLSLPKKDMESITKTIKDFIPK